jgi:cell division protease FtsH
LFLKKTTTGAANDFEKATEIARKMVCQWGMSDLGPLTFGERDDLVFLGKDLAMHKNFSEKTSEMIDEEVRKIISRNYDRTKELLEKNKDKLLNVAKALLDKEVLTSDELEAIIKGKKLVKSKKTSPASKMNKEKTKKELKKIQPIKKPDLAKA